MTISSYAMVSLAEMKTYLGITGSGSDSVLDDLISGVSLAIENLLQTRFVIRSFAENYPWEEVEQASLSVRPFSTPNDDIAFSFVGDSKIYLRQKPVTEITSIVDPDGNTVPATDYVLFGSKGYLRGSFPPPLDSNGHIAYWTITYKAGRFANTAAISGDTGDWSVSLACKIAVASLFNRGGDMAIQSKSIGDASISYGSQDQGGYPLPKEVINMLSPMAGVSI